MRDAASAAKSAVSAGPRFNNPLSIDIRVPDDLVDFVTTPAIAEAVKILYGGPLLDVNAFMYRLAPVALYQPGWDKDPACAEARNRMSEAISYAATGSLLQIDMMRDRGFDLIRALVRWDTVDQALAYALATSSYVYLEHRPTEGQPPEEPQYGTSMLLARDIIDWIAFGLPPTFALDRTALELTNAPRLPEFPERSAKRMNNIRFGDVAPETDVHSTYSNRVISSVLLSVPLHLVDRFFNHPAVIHRLGIGRHMRDMTDVIAEREERRKGVLEEINMRTFDNAIDMKSIPRRLQDNLFWQESFTRSNQHPSGFTLLATCVPSNA
jgi:hypothetical protein